MTPYTKAGYLNFLPYFTVLTYLTAARHDQLWQDPSVRNMRIETLEALDLIRPLYPIANRQMFTITPVGTRLLDHTRRHRNDCVYTEAAQVLGWSCVTCCREHFNEYGFWMAHSDLWCEHTFKGDMVCISCFEDRLGRPIFADDLNDAPLNDPFRNYLPLFSAYNRLYLTPNPYWQTIGKALAKIGVSLPWPTDLPEWPVDMPPSFCEFRASLREPAVHPPDWRLAA
jgi:hypothetical protein